MTAAVGQTMFGTGAVATQPGATSIGESASATNFSATALGYNAYAGIDPVTLNPGVFATALGSGSNATGNFAISIGEQHALNEGALGNFSVAIGTNATAQGTNAV